MSGTETTEEAVGQSTDRRMLAIMFADVVGYSRLIGLDDTGTLARVRTLRRDLIEPSITQHGGRLISTGGDSFFVVFGSSEGAMHCAVKVQEQVASFDADHASDRAIRFRVGINVGDTIADGTDVHGDAVNIAARLQTACPPGSICVSRSVYEQMQGRFAWNFEGLGALSLKNIVHPVEAFLVWSETLPKPASLPRFIAFVHPAIAVLPFRRYGSADESFADGLVDELINALSRWRSFPVIARESAFAYRDRDLDVRLLGRELGARYLVSGSVRRQANQIRVTLNLVDAETADNLLSDYYEQARSDLFLLQADLVRAIAGVLAPEVLKLERERAVQRPPTATNVYDLYQRGMWHRYRTSREHTEQAEALFRQVLTIDATHASARAALSLCRNFTAINRWVPDILAVHAESLVLARRAVADDPRDPHAHFALGVACMNNERRPEAMDELRETLRLNPSHVFALANLGHIFNFLNRPDEALPQIELALTLNPHDPRRFMWLPYLAASHYLAGRYKECLMSCEQALVANPGYPHAIRYLAAALGRLGRFEEAGRLVPRLRQMDGSFARARELCERLFVPEAADHIVGGWRLAGFT